MVVGRAATTETTTLVLVAVAARAEGTMMVTLETVTATVMARVENVFLSQALLLHLLLVMEEGG